MPRGWTKCMFTVQTNPLPTPTSALGYAAHWECQRNVLIHSYQRCFWIIFQPLNGLATLIFRSLNEEITDSGEREIEKKEWLCLFSLVFNVIQPVPLVADMCVCLDSDSLCVLQFWYEDKVCALWDEATFYFRCCTLIVKEWRNASMSYALISAISLFLQNPDLFTQKRLFLKLHHLNTHTLLTSRPLCNFLPWMRLEMRNENLSVPHLITIKQAYDRCVCAWSRILFFFCAMRMFVFVEWVVIEESHSVFKVICAVQCSDDKADFRI